jgi:hypothetical protein
VPASELHGGLLFKGRVPALYPNFVSTDAAAAQRDCRAMVRSLRQLQLPTGFGIKDSFANLDLSDAGFWCAIEGQWIGCEPPRDRRLPADGTLSFHWLQDVSGVRRWLDVAGIAGVGAEQVCRHPVASAVVSFLAVQRGEDVLAGAIFTRFGRATGISNVFALDDTLPVWFLVVQLAGERWKESALIGWEAGQSLERARAAGFSALHPMRVWIDVGGVS